MTDHITDAMQDLDKKSPFVCASCGHPADIPGLKGEKGGKDSSDFHDRFSDAALEEAEKSAFVCSSCGHTEVIRGVKS